jgi:hypothetical protein
METKTSLNHETPPIANVLLGEVLTEKQKRELAYVGHFSGAYQSMCWQNPIKDLQDKSGFVVVSTDRNYDDTVVKMSNLKQSQKDLLKQWNVL